MKEQNIKMRIIPESQRGDRAIVTMMSRFPLVRGTGALNYSCATCDTVILEGVSRNRFAELLIKCGECSSLNIVPGGS